MRFSSLNLNLVVILFESLALPFESTFLLEVDKIG